MAFLSAALKKKINKSFKNIVQIFPHEKQDGLVIQRNLLVDNKPHEKLRPHTLWYLTHFIALKVFSPTIIHS